MPGGIGTCLGKFAQDGALITVFPVAARRFSICNDLKFDAERDLKDIDAANIPVHALNKVGPSGNRFTEPGKFNFLLCVKAHCATLAVKRWVFLIEKVTDWLCMDLFRLSMETQLPQKESCLLPTLR